MARRRQNQGEPIESATVRPKRYSSGGEGFEAGQTAPSTKYRDRDGKIGDKEPRGGGWVVVIEGDVVTPAAARELAAGSKRRTAVVDDGDGVTPAADGDK